VISTAVESEANNRTADVKVNVSPSMAGAKSIVRVCSALQSA
jgi:hypothetical protein